MKVSLRSLVWYVRGKQRLLFIFIFFIYSFILLFFFLLYFLLNLQLKVQLCQVTTREQNSIHCYICLQVGVSHHVVCHRYTHLRSPLHPVSGTAECHYKQYVCCFFLGVENRSNCGHTTCFNVQNSQ